MNGKERMLTALSRGRPDRLPATIHQWQAYHLQNYMGGIDQIEAFRVTGLDASVTPWDLTSEEASPEWRRSITDLGTCDGIHKRRYRVETPSGPLTWVSATNAFTTYSEEHVCKTMQDCEVLLAHWPRHHLDRTTLSHWYDKTGDLGIVRGFVCCWNQPGVWQDFCELFGTEVAILLAQDEPKWVHGVLARLARIKRDYVEREMPGARYDLIEHGGGTASCTVISPRMFEEFTVPYDREVIDALHRVGHKVVYHTCGGMTRILDLIPKNGTDASETLSPPAVGGDIKEVDRKRVKEVLGSRVALIGGIDQHGVLNLGRPADVAAAVETCFATYGEGGGYICSASDHFFDAPVENLKAMAAAAASCRY